MPSRDGVGCRLAADCIAPFDLPRANEALRAGLAVRSLDLVGASSHAPVFLDAQPIAVVAGAALPPGRDAVIDPDRVVAFGSLVEVGETVEPGAQVRFKGHDVRAGAMLARRGDCLTAEQATAMALAGVETVEIAAVPVAIHLPRGPTRDWLLSRLIGWGGFLADDENAWIEIIKAAPDAAPRVALNPGETASLAARAGRIVLECPHRFDGAIAALLALFLPLVSRLAVLETPAITATTTRKITSRVGFTEVALFALEGDRVEPLSVGDITLASLARATAFALIPPGDEGLAGGDEITVTPFVTPLALEPPRPRP